MNNALESLSGIKQAFASHLVRETSMTFEQALESLNYDTDLQNIEKALKELAGIRGRAKEKQKYVLGLEAIAESIIVLRECYGKEKDEKLTTDAIELKKAVNIVWEELKLHAYATLPDDSVVDFKETVKSFVDEPHDIIDYILKGEKV